MSRIWPAQHSPWAHPEFICFSSASFSLRLYEPKGKTGFLHVRVGQCGVQCGVLENHGNQTAKERRQWYGLLGAECIQSSLSASTNRNPKEALIWFHQQPITPAPTSSTPFSFWNPLRCGRATFSAHLAVVTLTVSVPLHLCPLPLSVLPHVCLLSLCISLLLYLYLPHSEFLSARNRSANHTVQVTSPCPL